MNGPVFLHKNSLSLRPISLEDLDLIYKWHNNPEVTKYSLNKLVYPSDKSRIEKFINNSNSNKIITFSILDNKKNVGYIGLSSIDQINNKAEYFIFIGDKKNWGKGIGHKSSLLLIDYAFNTLNINRIELTVSAIHKSAIKLYKKIGFIEEGRKKQSCYRDGKYHDKLIMAILKKDW